MRKNPLKDCGSSPNCVSSTASAPFKRISPLPFRASASEVMKALREVILSLKRTRIVEETSFYLRAECRSYLGFVDEVEFFIDSEHRLLHMRSASQTGYWDLGVNRRRLEFIKDQLQKKAL